MDVCDIDTSPKITIGRVLRKLNILPKDFAMGNVYQGRHIAEKVIAEKGMRDAVFQFDEMILDSMGMPTYIFFDMSTDRVVYMHDNDPEDFKLCGYNKVAPISAIKKRAKIQDEYYWKCAGIFTMGHWIAKDLVERLGLPKEKVHHVGGAINVDKSIIDYSKKEGNKFLFVGKAFERKGGPLVYEAFNLLQKKYPEIELHVAGPQQNPYPNDTNPNYHFYGFCTHEKTAELFNMADFFVMPSRFEAYGLVFAEALAFGLPCIGRNAYEMPYFINDGETGLLLKEETPERLAELMEKNHQYTRIDK